MVGDYERITEAGFDCYIQKPIEPESFRGRDRTAAQRLIAKWWTTATSPSPPSDSNR
jgi:hypothetical protein